MGTRQRARHPILQGRELIDHAPDNTEKIAAAVTVAACGEVAAIHQQDHAGANAGAHQSSSRCPDTRRSNRAVCKQAGELEDADAIANASGVMEPSSWQRPSTSTSPRRKAVRPHGHRHQVHRSRLRGRMQATHLPNEQEGSTKGRVGMRDGQGQTLSRSSRLWRGFFAGRSRLSHLRDDVDRGGRSHRQAGNSHSGEYASSLPKTFNQKIQTPFMTMACPSKSWVLLTRPWTATISSR